jgi:hypothetical protein
MAAQALAETDQPGASVESSELYDDEVVRLSITVLRAGPTDRQKALDQLIARGNPDVVPTLILLLRYGRANEQYADAIPRLARVPGHIAYWFAWDGYLGVESALYGG